MEIWPGAGARGRDRGSVTGDSKKGWRTKPEACLPPGDAWRVAASWENRDKRCEKTWVKGCVV